MGEPNQAIPDQAFAEGSDVQVVAECFYGREYENAELYIVGFKRRIESILFGIRNIRIEKYTVSIPLIR